MYEICYYRTEDGKVPVKEFIDSLYIKMQVKAYSSLEILSQYGPLIREPYSKSLGEGLYELRIRFSGDITRIFYFFHYNHTIVVTNGFVKKTQKTPVIELRKARTYKEDFERRNK